MAEATGRGAFGRAFTPSSPWPGNWTRKQQERWGRRWHLYSDTECCIRRSKDAFSKLYGYTSNEQGVRHALLDRTDARAGQDEAVFMLGACASFASYLWRKHVAGATR